MGEAKADYLLLLLSVFVKAALAQHLFVDLLVFLAKGFARLLLAFQLRPFVAAIGVKLPPLLVLSAQLLATLLSRSNVLPRVVALVGVTHNLLTLVFAFHYNYNTLIHSYFAAPFEIRNCSIYSRP